MGIKERVLPPPHTSSRNGYPRRNSSLNEYSRAYIRSVLLLEREGSMEDRHMSILSHNNACAQRDPARCLPPREYLQEFWPVRYSGTASRTIGGQIASVMCGGRNRTTALSPEYQRIFGRDSSRFRDAHVGRALRSVRSRREIDRGGRISPLRPRKSPFDREEGERSFEKMGNACYLDTKRDRCDSLFVCVVKMHKERIAKAIRSFVQSDALKNGAVISHRFPFAQSRELQPIVSPMRFHGRTMAGDLPKGGCHEKNRLPRRGAGNSCPRRGDRR